MTRTSPTYIHGRIIIYLYFPLGRLTRENDEDRSVTICYNYDSNGNILSKVEYPYTTGALTSATRTVPYTYAVSWGDQLLTYNNGSTILYDQIGNPLSYNGYTFTWQKGRQLASANDGTNSYQFIYNADGQRTWKTKNNSSTQYTYASGLLVSMTDETNTLNFTYDPDGIALGVNLNSTDYYYLYNAQGDVIALYDSAGTVVTEYKYDSWGKLLSTTGSAAATIGLLNPLRYRGYFYDTDLGFYLLETRYYDPETGRFINADGVLDTRDVSTTNIFSYCANDPVNNVDEDGNLSRIAIGAIAGGIVGGIVGGIKAYSKHGKNWKKIAAGVGKGALIGAVTGAFGAKAGRVATALLNTVVSYGTSRISHIKVKKKTKTYTVPQVKKTPNTKAKGRANSAKQKTYKSVSVTYNTLDFSRTKTEIHEDRRALVAGIVSGVITAGVSSVARGALLYEKGFSINDIANIGAHATLNLNTSAFEAITDCSIALFQEGSK